MAFILAGGFGTRLRSVLNDIPKPMAEAGGKPFLEHLLLWLKGQGVSEVVLLTHYLSEKIENYFSNGETLGMNIQYIREHEPLGTGGAVKAAISTLEFKNPFLLLNGDSFIDFEVGPFLANFSEKDGGIVLSKQRNTDRYGAVNLNSQGILQGFEEKRVGLGAGVINAGVYYLQPEWFTHTPNGRLSLEMDVIPLWIHQGMKIQGHIVDGVFLDIGLPESYRQFIEYMSNRRGL